MSTVTQQPSTTTPAAPAPSPAQPALNGNGSAPHTDAKPAATNGSANGVANGAPNGTGGPSTVQPAEKVAFDGGRQRVKKRIIVCCDGTWQDALDASRPYMYTNVLRIARAIYHDDRRFEPPVPQIVFYQSGVGTDDNLYSKYIEGGTGSDLGDKVQEAYGFISQNYQRGDEIYIIGFSRGAYTARMVAMFIGEIGVLNKVDMDHFADIYTAYQKRSTSKDPQVIATQDKFLQDWTGPDSPGKKRVDTGPKGFGIQCVAVFDTVGSLGLPIELTGKTSQPFLGFKDKLLGPHVQRAYHAMSIDEHRDDFNVCKFEQTDEGRAKGQILEQCWFAGEHSDIGGGWEQRDLADITLGWMTARLRDLLAMDTTYLLGPDRRKPVAPYGQMAPHDSRTGIFALTKPIQRQLPTSTDDTTYEVIHPSVLHQTPESQPKVVQQHLKDYPNLITTLKDLEEELKEHWGYDAAEAAKTVSSKVRQGTIPPPNQKESAPDVVNNEQKQQEQTMSDVGKGGSDAVADAIVKEGGTLFRRFSRMIKRVASGGGSSSSD